MFRWLRWALIPIVAAHNFEEWLTFPIYGGPDAPWPVVQLALLLVTIVPVLVVVWAASGRETQNKHLAVLWVAGIFAANAFLPHVPAAFIARGYSPGLITAIAINLPFAFFLYRAALREGMATARSAALTLVLSALTIPIGVFAALGLSSVIIRQ